MFFGKLGKAQYALEGIRQPMYAGSWYEGDGEKLACQLDTFIADAVPIVDSHSAHLITADNHPLSNPVLSIIVPHAGYFFSGKAAAHAYKAVQGQMVKRVFLLGPSHHTGFHGIALPFAVTFATPVGDLEVDKEVVAELSDYPLFARMPEVHRVEHSLEMQLPFIRKAFGEVKIVPIIVGTLVDDAEIHLVAEILKRYISKEDLVVVSSDFTHYGPRYDYRPFQDNVKENIRKLDSVAYSYINRLDLPGFLKFQQESKDTICGFYPCAILTAILPREAKSTVLKYYTSQSTSVEDKDNSVSYLAMAFSGGSWGEPASVRLPASDSIELSQADKGALLKLARLTVEVYVREKKTPTAEELGITITKPMTKVLGAFVTLNKFASPREDTDRDPSSHGNAALHHGKELRGCIGHIWPLRPLYQAIIENAINACSRDYRFEPVRPDELKDIHIEISVLTPMRRISSYHDIVLGRDGIVLLKDGHQSVFLPFVHTEFGWDLKETLTQLSHKAGLEPTAWQSGAKFDVFQAVVFDDGQARNVVDHLRPN